MFRIPISITKPSNLINNRFKYKLFYGPGFIDRKFVVVPEGATWADLTITAQGPRSKGRFVVHVMQIMPHLKHTKSEFQWYFNLFSDDVIPGKSFAVHEGSTLEICSSQFWSSSGMNEYTINLNY